MESYQLSSYYTAISVITIFIAVVLFVCWKLAQSSAKIEETGARQRPYQPSRPIVPQPKLRQIRQPKYSVGSQTSNAESLYVKFKKEAAKYLALPKSESSSSTCLNCGPDSSKKTEQKYLISESYYQSPYESVSEILKHSSKMSDDL